VDAGGGIEVAPLTTNFDFGGAFHCEISMEFL
jgi:hypothetical protein